MTQAKKTYEYISADSHLEVPAERWGHWIPKEYREWAPRKVLLADGGEGFVVKGSKPVTPHVSLYAGHSPEEFSPYGTPWAGPGSGPAKQRLAEQDQDGVDAEVLYASPQALRITRLVTDPEAYHAVVAAYNEWLAKEVCAEDPKRLLGVGILPVSDVDATVAELTHCKRLGLPTVAMGNFPAGHRYPSDEDDRFWAAALDLDMPLTVHVSMSAMDDSKEPVFVYPKSPMGQEWAPTDFVNRCYRYGIRGAMNAVQMMLQGVFDRFPRLRVYFAENQIAWLPLFLQQLDRQYERSCIWAERELGVPRLQRRPSEYIKEHCYWGFFDDPEGVDLLEKIGPDRVMWSTDFPHIESAWPRSRELADEMFRSVPDQVRWRVTAGTAIEYFHLDRG